jgi:hypothetical protein
MKQKINKSKLSSLRQPMQAIQFTERGADSACGCLTTKPPELQIPYEVDCLERNVNALSGLVSDLEAKLSPATYQVPTPDCEAREKNFPLCPLAESLRIINNEIISLRQRIEAAVAGLQI